MYRNPSAWTFWFATASIIVLDQVTKHLWAAQSLHGTCNPGMAFGWSLPLSLFYPLLGIFLLFLWYLWQQNRSTLVQVGLILALAGALSNIWDRFTAGCIRDFLPLPGTSLTNNLADYSLALGAVLLVYWSVTRGATNRPSHTNLADTRNT